MPFGVSPQRNDWSYSSERPGCEHLPVVFPVDDLVHVAEHDMRGVHARVDEHLDLLDGSGAGLAMGQDRGAGPTMRLGGRGEDQAIPWGRPAEAAGDLDDPGSMAGTPDDRA